MTIHLALDDETCPTLDTSRVARMFVSIQTTKICVRKKASTLRTIELGVRIKPLSRVPLRLEIQTDPNERFFVRLARREHVPCTAIHSIFFFKSTPTPKNPAPAASPSFSRSKPCSSSSSSSLRRRTKSALISFSSFA